MNNFLTISPRPIGQRKYFATPRVATFSDDDLFILTEDINSWIDDLALPVDVENLYTVLRIEYTSTPLANIITHSALVHYLHWVLV
jgi:hypothetical protein